MIISCRHMWPRPLYVHTSNAVSSPSDELSVNEITSVYTDRCTELLTPTLLLLLSPLAFVSSLT